MSYLVLARKYRPQNFKEVSGQEHVTRTLANAIKRNKIPHAVLLTGPRGVGKTSIARIFSKALNCEKGPTAEPCLKCTNCEEITQGRSLAVQEIDGASHNSVDNIRELIETFRSLPAPGYKYKIYIIDEVHMLSTAAFNALLKSLEEPPPHTIFILATTEVHKIPETVISRCQRHDLRALSHTEVRDQLEKIAKLEKLKIEPDAIRMIARLSEGSMRDAQSLLDRVQTYCEDKITAAETGSILGMVAKSMLFNISEAIFKRDPAKVLDLIHEAFSTGLDISVFLKEFVQHWRELLIAKFGAEKSLKGTGIAEDEAVEVMRQAGSVDGADLQDLVQIAREGADIAIRSAQPLLALEALLVRMASREKVKDLSKIIEEFSKGGGTRPETSAATVKSPVISAPTAVTTAAKPSGGNGKEQLRWNDFIVFLSSNTSKMLIEYVKRLEVLEFYRGGLTVKGPEFTIKSFEKGDYREKLLAALEKFSDLKNWDLRLSTASGTEIGSLASFSQQEKQRNIETIADKKRNISEHPHIQKLKAVFPGSAIEDIKIKD
jgi:DNA polymerase-3 subunit gamma/tau